MLLPVCTELQKASPSQCKAGVKVAYTESRVTCCTATGGSMVPHYVVLHTGVACVRRSHMCCRPRAAMHTSPTASLGKALPLPTNSHASASFMQSW